MRRARLVVLALCVGCGAGGGAASHGVPAADRGGVAIYAPAVPEPAAGNAAALYLRAVDTDGDGDRLLGASSPAAGGAMLHASVHDEAGSVRMQPVPEGFPLPSGGELALEPGGRHVMLMRLARPLREGDELEVTLSFEEAGAIAIRVPVVSYAELDAREPGTGHAP